MATRHRILARRFLRHFAVLALVLLSVTTRTKPVLAEPPLLPHRPWIGGFGSLCDAGPLVCTRIDEIGFNARIDAILLTSTSKRGIGTVEALFTQRPMSKVS